MLESFSFMQPALLGGLALLALPVLVHLLLRPRPRRVLFPALRLTRGALTSGQRASRTRNVLLMLLRAALLAGAVLLLAGPTCRLATDTHAVAGPVAGVIVLDDSLSMSYQPRYDDDTTLLGLALRQARAAIQSAAAWPTGSQLAVVRAGSAERTERLTGDRAALLSELRAHDERPPHARPLGDAIRVAARLLREARPLAPRLIVFTDMSAAAWRDVRPALLSGIAGLDVRVVGPPVGPRSNVGLVSVIGPAGIHVAPMDVALRVSVAASELDAQCRLTALSGEQVWTQVGPVRVTANQRIETVLRLPALPVGVHAGTVLLQPEDLLAADQRRYLVWQNGPRPVVWLLTPGGQHSDGDLSMLIFRNLLAPTTLESHSQRVAVRTVQPHEIGEFLRPAGDGRGVAANRPALIMVFPGVPLATADITALRAAVEAGTVLLLMPDSSSRKPDWPGLRELVCQAATLEETPDAGTTIRWEPATAALLSEEVLLELSRSRVYRRIELSGLLAGVTTDAAYLDGRPAIVTRTLGRGRVVVLTTSPDPLWSEMGARAAGLMTFLHRTVEQAVGPPTAVASFTAGQTATEVLPALPRAGPVRVARLEPSPAPEPAWVRLTNGVPEPPWPTDRPGIYAIHASGRPEPSAVYVVNWPAEEFDLTPIDRVGLERTLGTENLVFGSWDSSALDPSETTSAALNILADPVLPIGALLFLLFVVEMALAASGATKSPARSQAP